MDTHQTLRINGLKIGVWMDSVVDRNVAREREGDAVDDRNREIISYNFKRCAAFGE